MTAPPRAGTHLVLVSDQPVPSLVPVLDPALGVKRVWLAATAYRKTHAEQLAETLRRHGREVEILAVERPFERAAVAAQFRAWLGRAPEGGLAVNLTGGSKPMAIAAYEACREAGVPAYYVRIDTHALAWLHPEGRPDHPLPPVLTLEDILTANGVEMVALSREAPYPEGWLRLAHDIAADPHLQGRLARLGNQDVPRNPPDALKGKGLLHRTGLGWIWAGDDARRFVAGGWLEALVFDVLDRLRRDASDLGIHDLACNVRIRRPAQAGEALDGELDVAVMRENTLFVVECKSGRMDDRHKGNAKDQERMILNLADVGELLGGLRGRTALVSRNELTPNQARLVRHLGIQVVQGAEALARLEMPLRLWLGHPAGP